MDLGMQGFDPAVENLRRAGEFRNFKRGNVFRLKSVCRSAGGDDFDSEGLEFTGEINDAFLVRNGNQGAPNFHTEASAAMVAGRSAGDK